MLELVTYGRDVELIDSKLIEPDLFVVLAYWNENPQPWVTWCSDRKGNTYWGHYFEEESEARKDFRSRVEKVSGQSRLKKDIRNTLKDW